MFEGMGFFESAVLALMLGIFLTIYRGPNVFNIGHRDRLYEAKRQTIYLKYIAHHTRNSDLKLSSERKDQYYNQLLADLECIGLEKEAAHAVYEKYARKLGEKTD
jgi:hypothetical protein